jgi:hypothetical protein
MRTHVRAKGFVSAMSGMVRSHMTKPKTEIEQRLDRLEAAVKTMANWLVQAPNGIRCQGRTRNSPDSRWGW